MDIEVKNAASETSLGAGEAPALEAALSTEESAELQALMEAGVFYGQSHSRTNPKMSRYVLTSKGGVEVLDLISTLRALQEAQKLIRDKVAVGGEVILVGTTPAAKATVRALGEELKVPYVAERWLGGTLTNFKTIVERIRYFKKLKADIESGALDKYTKKERVNFNREIGKLTRFFSGIESVDKLPGIVVVFGLGGNEIAALEARKTGVASVAFVNTAADPDLVSCPIPANDRSPESLKLLATYIEKAILEGKEERAKQVSAETAEKANGQGK
jgi:small subunit ribosomal protein S2